MFPTQCMNGETIFYQGNCFTQNIWLGRKKSINDFLIWSNSNDLPYSVLGTLSWSPKILKAIKKKIKKKLLKIKEKMIFLKTNAKKFHPFFLKHFQINLLYLTWYYFRTKVKFPEFKCGTMTSGDNIYLKGANSYIPENNLVKAKQQCRQWNFNEIIPSKKEKTKHMINCYNYSTLLVGPPTLTTSKGFGSNANSSCQTEAARLRAAESAWWRAPTVRTWDWKPKKKTEVHNHNCNRL